MSIRMTIERTQQIDLNAYWKSFSPGLKKRIQDEIFGSWSGNVKPDISKKTLTRALNGCEHFVLTGKKNPPVGSKTYLLVKDLSESTSKGEAIEKTEIQKMADARGMSARQVCGNLLASGYLKKANLP
jgi:hypothetical protein